MKQFSSLFILFFVVTLTYGCSFWNCEKGKGDVTKETRQLEAFTEVSFNLAGDMIIEQVGAAEQLSIEIETHSDLMQFIKTEVEDGKLTIHSDPCIDAKDKLVFRLKVSTLTQLTINGSGDVTNNGTLTGKETAVKINGSGDAELKMEVSKLIVGINGSGDLKLNGEAQQTEVSINGSGDMEAFSFKTSYADVNIMGSGDCDLKVTEKLDAKVIGSGDVSYSGNPATVNRSIVGSGDIEPK